MAKIKLNMSDNSSKDSNNFNLGPSYITISNVPATAVQGYLTQEQLDVLDSDVNNNYIMFYGEKFIPMDITSGTGYRVYTHHGETEDKKEVSKFIYLNTTLTDGQGYFWVMNVNENRLYTHIISISTSGQALWSTDSTFRINTNIILTTKTSEQINSYSKLKKYLAVQKNYYISGYATEVIASRQPKGGIVASIQLQSNYMFFTVLNPLTGIITVSNNITNPTISDSVIEQ